MTETPTPWEQARRPGVELAAKLAVRPDIEGGECVLVVDCLDVMRSENDVRFWALHPGEMDGTWSHIPSGELNHPLSETLLSIAGCYADRVNPADPPESRPLQVEVYARKSTVSDAKPYRWRVRHSANGEIMSQGQGYADRRDRDHAVALLHPDLEVVEVER